MLIVFIRKRFYVFKSITRKFHSITQSIGIWQLTLTQSLVYTAEICFKKIVEEKRALKVCTNNVKYEYVSSGY